MGAINQQAMDQLQYVTELTDRIRTTSSPHSNGTEDSSEFVSFFPDFVWTLRDVTVRLEADGQSLTADEYLENSLKLKQGTSKEDKNYNLPRLCIRKFFPRRKCFVFYPPTEWKKLSELENLRDDELDSDFVQQAAEFCSFILSSSKAKALPGGVKVNGARLEKLVLSYIDAMSSGDLPCMENAVLALAKIENLAAMQKAIAHYDQQMNQGMQLPTETLQELLNLHRTCEREAIEIFLRTSFKDEDHAFQKELLAQLEKRWEVTCNKNVKLSSDLCSELLRNIFSPLEEAVTKDAYSQPGGYLLFVEKREELKKKYLREPRKGIQAEEILQAYLQSSVVMAETILQRDQALTVKQKEIEVERVKADSAQASVDLLEEMEKKHVQMMKERERCHQERVRQLTAKMDGERAQIVKEQERILALKLQEQERLLKEGMKEESRRLQNEIQVMEKRNKEKEAEYAQATIKMLEDMHKMEQYLMAKKGETHQEHMKQFTEKKKEELGCQHFGGEVSMRPNSCKWGMSRNVDEDSSKVVMASETMKAPICLVENKNKQLLVNRRAIEILNSISQPVVVVGIVGMYRTGKSYLMNCLAGQNNGFPLGSTVQSQTKGIWMWCVPHPTKPNHTLILLDTEGLGDVEKGDPTNDAWIFALAILLSSTFVYNSMSTINNDALEKLHYMTKLTELIRAKSSPRSNAIEDAREFVSFFPDFIWTVRDFTLELKLDGHCITEDDYLENALKLIPGQNPQIQTSNWSRECIRQFFPRRKCFVFDWPVSDQQLLAKIESIPESQLNPKFQKQSKTFCSHIFTHASTKKLREGVLVTGNRLGTLVETYVDAINSGTVPCLENAVKTLAQRENSAAVQKAADHYTEQMAQRVRLPTDTLQELLDVHTACEKEAITVFMEHSFLDDHWEFQKKLVATVEKRKEAFMQQNEAASLSYCQAELERLSESLTENISCGAFSVPGGHSLYLEVRKKVEQTYKQVPRKGVKATEVFQNFLKSQITIEASILQSDKALTDGQKAMAAEQAKKEAAEKEVELMRQQQTEQEQAKEAQMRTLSENMAQLQKKMESERENLLREQERVLDHKIKVLKELILDGVEEKYDDLRREIKLKEEEIEDIKHSSIQNILDIASNILTESLPVLCNIGMQILSSYVLG
ncbi:guanylate-binding protein 4-like isoform X2 [Arvicola amphibius]|nr:guanylate-binding protein 4-like isoform X2 [Arvicola amphibius]